jgi:hypothetical protein
MASIIPQLIQRVAEIVHDELDHNVTANIEPDREVYVGSKQGRNRRIYAVSIQGIFKRTLAGPVRLKFRIVDETQIAYGEIIESPFSEFRRVTVGLVEPRGKAVRGEVYLETEEDSKLVVESLALPSDDQQSAWVVGAVHVSL